MFTTGSKLFFGIAAAALVAAVVYLLDSEAEFLGVVILLALSGAAAFLGAVVVAFRDADVEAPPEAAASAADAEGASASGPEIGGSAWPVVGAFGAGFVVLGLVLDPLFFVLGAVVLLVVVLEWMVQSWAERASSDPRYNRELRDQVMQPFELPVGGLLIAAFVVIGFSRVLLAIPSDASVLVFIAVAALVLLMAVLLSTRPRIGTNVLAAVLLVGGVAVLGGGVVGAAVGEREFHHPEEEDPEATNGVSAKARVAAYVIADDVAFRTTELRIPRALDVSIIFDNRDDGVEHSLHITGPVALAGEPVGGAAEGEADGEGTAGADEPEAGEEPDSGEEAVEGGDEADTGGDPAGGSPAVDVHTRVDEGPSEQYIIVEFPAAGEYEFFCDVHPEQMRGTIITI
jgi:plastocyanin